MPHRSASTVRRMPVGPKKRRENRSRQYESLSYRRVQRRVALALRRLRTERGWTQEEAAHRCGMSTRLYQYAETGDANLTFTTIARLCDGLDVDVSKLFEKHAR